MRPMTNINEADKDILLEVDTLGNQVSDARARIGEVIFGQEKVIDFALTALLSGGHALFVGVPGL